MQKYDKIYKVYYNVTHTNDNVTHKWQCYTHKYSKILYIILSIKNIYSAQWLK